MCKLSDVNNLLLVLKVKLANYSQRFTERTRVHNNVEKNAAKHLLACDLATCSLEYRQRHRTKLKNCYATNFGKKKGNSKKFENKIIFF